MSFEPSHVYMLPMHAINMPDAMLVRDKQFGGNLQSPCFDIGTHPHKHLLLQSLLHYISVSDRACAVAMQRMVLESQWRQRL